MCFYLVGSSVVAEVKLVCLLESPRLQILTAVVHTQFCEPGTLKPNME